MTQLRAAVRSSFICHRMWDKKSVSGSGIFRGDPPLLVVVVVRDQPSCACTKKLTGVAAGTWVNVKDGRRWRLSTWTTATFGLGSNCRYVDWSYRENWTVNSSSTIPFQSVIFTTADRLEIYNTVSNSLARRRRLTSQSKLPKNVWGFQPDPPYRQLARPTRYTPSAAILLSSFNYL